MKRKKTLESDVVNHGNKLCHPAHDDKQLTPALAPRMPVIPTMYGMYYW